jgi:AraC-like DNA-binding protein
MLPVAIPRLERHRIFASRDVEETAAFLHRKCFRFDIDPHEANALDAEINGIYLPNGPDGYTSYIGYTRYGAPMTLTAECGRSDYWVQFVVAGCLRTTGAGEVVTCDAGTASICSPTRRDYYTVEAGRDAVVIRLSFTKAAVLKNLASLQGEEPTIAPAFAPLLDLTTGHGRSLRHLVLSAVADFSDPNSALHQPAAMRALEHLLLTLLLAQPNDAPERFARAASAIAPRDVARAVDFIEANLAARIALADIATAAGVPGRTLHAHFQRFKGVSPLGYLREARFRAARRALTSPAPGATTTGIATSCGFDHLGRFAVEYRRRFGECPSETLRRHRR